MRARLVVLLLLCLGAGALSAISVDAGAQTAATATAGSSVEVHPPVVPQVVFGSDAPDPGAGDVAPSPKQVDPSVVEPGPPGDPIAQLSADGDGGFRIESLVTLSPPLIAWDGQGGGRPNDTNGDVGPNHFVQAVNGGFQVFDKFGTSVAGPAQISSLWNDGVRDEACEFERGDPIVLYDNLADRWLISQFQPKPTETGGAFSEFICVAISQTPDPRPSQGYFLYAFDVVNGEFPDYFKIGAWTDGYYMSANTNNITVRVFDRLNMLNGNPAGMITFPDVANTGYTGFDVLMPSDIDGLTAPPSGSGYFYRPFDGADANRIDFYSADVDWGNPPASTLTQSNIPLAPYDHALCGFGSFGCAPQPGTSAVLDPVNEVGMFRFPYRNYGDREVLAGNFTVDVDGGDSHGIRWFVLQRTGGAWSVADQGTYAPQPPGAPAFVHRFMGSVAMDSHGNLGIGYTATSASGVFPSARYAGRAAGDPPGTLTATEQVMRPGVASIPADGAVPPNQNDTRWGDYYALTVDPVDDCTFWYTGDYGAAGGVRQSVIGSFRFSDCGTDLRITKSASPTQPHAGEDVTYTVTVFNEGAVDATNVEVIDDLPDEVTYLADTDSCTGTDPLTCSLGDIPAGGSVSFQVNTRLDADLGGTLTITNVASVSADQGEVDPADNTITYTQFVNTDSADLSIVKTGAASAVAGEPYSYSLTVHNAGPSTAVGVEVTDTLPADFLLSGASPSVGSCGAGPVVTCNLGNMTPGATETITINGDVDPGATNPLANTASVASQTFDQDNTNNVDSTVTPVTTEADLAVVKTGPTTVLAGMSFTDTVLVTNEGPSVARNVVLTDTMPPGTSLVSAVDANGVGVCAELVPGVLTCDLGDLDPSESTSVFVTLAVPPSTADGTVLTNDASAVSDTPDPDPGDNSDNVSTTVHTSAELWIEKSGTASAGNPSGALVYRITVHNRPGFSNDATPTSGSGGPSDAVDVEVTDTLPLTPKKMTVQFLSPGCSYSAATHRVICTTALLPYGTDVTFEIQVQIKGSVGTITNRARITDSGTPDPVTGNNDDTVNNVIQGSTGKGSKP
jgi:uncharacterized repeat protein (TIGR01451 family)